MGLPIAQVDAFTDRPFAGNPAAICLLDGPADEQWMQAVAAEMNQPETAFLEPIIDLDAGTDVRGSTWRLRWFTPVCEVELCGHATLAAAHHLLVDLGVEACELRFVTLSGTLTACSATAGSSSTSPSTCPWRSRPPPGCSRRWASTTPSPWPGVAPTG